MNTLTTTFALFDGPALPDRQSGEPVLRYRGVAYRRSELTRPRPAEAPRLMYRGVAYRPAAAAPAPGQRRYRGVAY